MPSSLPPKHLTEPERKRDKMRILPGTKSSRDATGDGSAPPPPKTAEEKNRHRRMQVRRAQIQHRQRKANHLKQLELDVCQLRDLIALAEHDSNTMKRQNDDMRAVLRSATVSADHGHDRDMHGVVPLPSSRSWPLPGQPSPDMFHDIELDDLTVSLSSNEVMGTPCFQISPRSSNGSSPSPGGNGPRDLSTPEAPLTPEQELRAINFILAMEHICWNHFVIGDFHSHTRESEKPRGHALTASAYLMSSAPESVYKERDAFQTKSINPWRRSKSPPPPAIQWHAPSISLTSLLGLARSLNPGDKETTPVQAWFELASRYPVDLLLGGEMLDVLLREFSGVVKCIHFGAVIERTAFESVVARILGPPQTAVGALA